MRIRVPDKPTASRQYTGKSLKREPGAILRHSGVHLTAVKPSGIRTGILKEPAMNEPHLRETAALELVLHMTLPQQNAGIPPIIAGDISIYPEWDIKSWPELNAADGIIYFCVWALPRADGRYDLYIGCA